MDYNHIGALLHILDKAKDHPNLRNIHNEAMRELLEINADLAPPEKVRPAPEPSLGDPDAPQGERRI